MRVRSYAIVGLILVMLTNGCAAEGRTPSPVTSPTATMGGPDLLTPVSSPTPVPESIPVDGLSVTLAAKGEFIVTGEVEGATGLAYFLDSAGWLYVFDGASLEVVAKEQVLSPAGEAGSYDLAVDGGSRRVYVADGPGEETLVLDSEALSAMGRIDAYGSLAVDPMTHRLYIAREGVYVADGKTGAIIDQIEGTMPEEGLETFSGVPRGVDVYINPGNRHLYVMMDNNTPGSNSRRWLDLYDADDYTLLAEALPLSYGLSSIPGFDLDKGLDYLAGSHPIAGDRKLVALDAGASEFGHLWGVGGSVFFSPRHQLLYVTHSTGWGETWLDVLHPQTMDYLDSIAVKASLHDPQNGRFYALGWQEPHITVFDEPTVSLDAREAMIAPSGSLPVDLDSLVLSPAFTGDRTLFATSGASLFTSSDAGETWSEITLPFLVRGTMGVALSPDYALGRTILVGMACTPSGNGILRSTDGGRNWSRVNSGLTDLGIEALLFSPDYAHDGTVFADGCFDGAFKSTDGGTTWRPLKIDLPTGEWSGKPLGQLMMSPAYPPDGQLWFLTPSRVLRSLDAGETWERADIGLEGLELDRLVLSPNYQVDSTALVTIGRGIYITRNGGEAWQVMPLPSPELWVTDLALSPDFVTDHVLFVAGFDKDYADRLYRSSDAGRTWLSVGEEFAGDSFVALTLSPLYSEDGLVFVSTDRGVYRSADGGEKWKLLNLPGARFLFFSPSFSSDHTIYASSQQGLYRSQDSGENWSGLQQSAEPVPTPVPAPEASPAPIPRATSIACPALDPVFQSVADRVESLRLSSGALPNVGCPTGPAQTVSSAWQIFLAQAPGSDASAAAAYLIWRSDSRAVYFIPPPDSTTGRCEAAVYEDTWSEGMPEIPPSCAGLTPPTGLQIPIRGFGKVWCEHGLYDDIGFAYGLEKGGDFLIQEAERGLYISVPEVGSFVIDIVNGLALSQ